MALTASMEWRTLTVFGWECLKFKSYSNDRQYDRKLIGRIFVCDNGIHRAKTIKGKVDYFASLERAKQWVEDNG